MAVAVGSARLVGAASARPSLETAGLLGLLVVAVACGGFRAFIAVIVGDSVAAGYPGQSRQLNPTL